MIFKGINQKELAAKAVVGVRTIRRIMRLAGVPYIDTLALLFNALDFDICDAEMIIWRQAKSIASLHQKNTTK